MFPSQTLTRESMKEIVCVSVHCPAGTFAGEKQQQCTHCPRGFYQNRDRQGSCSRCPMGTYTREEGRRYYIISTEMQDQTHSKYCIGIRLKIAVCVISEMKHTPFSCLVEESFHIYEYLLHFDCHYSDLMNIFLKNLSLQ
jgi:hypothetical protein